MLCWREGTYLVVVVVVGFLAVYKNEMGKGNCVRTRGYGILLAKSRRSLERTAKRFTLFEFKTGMCCWGGYLSRCRGRMGIGCRSRCLAVKEKEKDRKSVV